MFLLQWLLNAANALLQEIPPPKSKQTIAQPLITPEQGLSPSERDIVARAEASFRLLEAESQVVLTQIRETPVVAPDPAPVRFVEVSDVLEISTPTRVAEIAEVPEVPEVAEIPEVLAAVELAPVGWAAIEAGTEADPAPPPAEMPRKQLVEGLLDEAWQQGHKTYAALIGYVAEQTGTGCSKRVVAAWKQSRQLATAA